VSILQLPPMPEDAAPVIVPGLLAALGITRRPADPDFQASIDGGFTESFEDYCTRISKEETRNA
jgi:hypothetical protein